MEKRGFYLSIDAIIAAMLLAVGLLLASTLHVEESETKSVEHYSQDMVNILSSAKVYEFNNSLINQLIASGQIDDINKTLLEQAVQFWAEGNESLATEFLSVTAGIVPEKFRSGIFFGNELVYGINSTTTPVALVSSKRFVSGIQKGKPVQGFSAQAQLTSFKTRSSSSYYYFGGFAGQGNLTIRIDLPTFPVNITSAYLEVDASDNFSLYFNDVYSGFYKKSSGGGGYKLADKWQINYSYLGNFNSSENYVSLKFPDSFGFVGGGFLKISYLTSELNDSAVTFYEGKATTRYYFPRIDGLINLYDSFFVPGALSALTAHLHYNSSFNTFLTIGNATVFSLNSTEVQVVDLSNDNLASKLNYATLSSTTVPVRLGSGTGNSTIFSTGNADVVLANDLSGTMEYCANNPCSTADLGPQNYCGTGHNEKPSIGTYCNYTQENYLLPNGSAVCSYRWHARCPSNDTRKLDIAISASKQFTTVLLGTLGNKMGIVGYTNPSPSVKVIPANGSWNDRFDPFPDSIVTYENLTGNSQVIFNNINNFMDSYWESCLCCGVEKARDILLNGSTPSRFKSMVVMSDGEATDKCTGVGGGNAKQDAIKAANNTCTNYNISVNTVAFGASADAATLKAMACNNGSFYNASNLADLIEVYRKIADDINKVAYKEQVINFSGALPAASLLFGDSYIEYNYTPNLISGFGVIPATLESPRFGNNISDTTLNIPPYMKLSEVRVTSYSADKWTDNLTISNSVQNRNAFSLAGITNDYVVVGDPFVVYASPDLFEAGNNKVRISTGTGPGNYTGGSNDNMIIYKVLVPNSVPEEGVFSKSDGCKWQVTFEDGSNASLAVPQDYSGAESCTFSPTTYPDNDALDNAVFRLLNVLDFDKDGLVDVKFGTGGLGVNAFIIRDVPSLWGPTVAEVRVWQ